MLVADAELRQRVVEPLLRALRVELGFLEKGNATWSFFDRRLTHLKPLRQYVHPDVRSLYDRLMADRNDLASLVAGHDELLEKLRTAATTAYRHLMNDEAFLDDVRTWRESYEREHPDRPYPGGAYPRDRFPELVADRVVNRIGVLPDHYADQHFWAEHRSKAMAYRRGEKFGAVDDLTERLGDCNRRLVTTLARIPASG